MLSICRNLVMALTAALSLACAVQGLAENEWRLQLTIAIDKADYVEGEPILAGASVTNISDDPIRFMGVAVGGVPNSDCYITATSGDGKIYVPSSTHVDSLNTGDISVRLAPGESITSWLHELADFLLVDAAGDGIIVPDPDTIGGSRFAHLGPLPPGTYTMQAKSTQLFWGVPEGTVYTEEIVEGNLYSNTVEFNVHQAGAKLPTQPKVMVAGKPISDKQKPFRLKGQFYLPADALSPVQVAAKVQGDKVQVSHGKAKRELPVGRWAKGKPGKPAVVPALKTSEGKLYLPVREIASALGLRCDWNAKTKTLSITAAKA